MVKFELITSLITAFQIQLILGNHLDVISFSEDDIGCVKKGVTPHKIVLTDNTPIKQKNYKISPPMREKVEEHVDRLLASDIIGLSDSPWNSPFIPILKKDNTIRLVIDYRAVNLKSCTDSFPLPNLTDHVYGLFGSNYFTKIDMRKGYYMIPMDEESQPITAFSTPTRHVQFKRLPMGLKNAPACFMKEIQRILQGFSSSKIVAYLDDVLIHTETFEEHIDLINRV